MYVLFLDVVKLVVKGDEDEFESYLGVDSVVNKGDLETCLGVVGEDYKTEFGTVNCVAD